MFFFSARVLFSRSRQPAPTRSAKWKSDPLQIGNLYRIERIDGAIGKTVKRLFQLKTMKQMYRQLHPKTIVSKTVEAPPGQIEKTPSA